jgi:DNA polymerase (family 10)
MEQKREIDALNKKMRGFRILAGTEVDILSDGTLDFPDDVLKKMDIVVASVHSGFRQDRGRITRRLTTAMKNQCVSVIAHPTGRLIGERDPYDLDLDAVLRVAGETGTALEINAYPLRLDLNDIHARKAKDAGVRMVISTDTHVTEQFAHMQYGVSIARRGWLGKEDVLNTRTYAQLQKILRKTLS